MQLRPEVIPISCNDIVVIMLDLRTLLSVSSTCGTVCQQIVWIFPPLWHSNEQSNKLILRLFYLVPLMKPEDLDLCALARKVALLEGTVAKHSSALQEVNTKLARESAGVAGMVNMPLKVDKP